MDHRRYDRIELREEGLEDLAGYAHVSIAFQVSRVLVPAPDLGPLAFRERRVERPYWKDYDALPGAHPTSWRERFDITSWRIISVWRGPARVGGTVLIRGGAGIETLEGRDDLTLIWDLRVSPESRGVGIGSALIRAAEQWAGSRGSTRLEVETQNINIAACRFYEKCGFAIKAVNPTAYPGLEEIQMLWHKRIVP
jgi:GNAT superfamily N-acetyltransferase